MKTALVSVGCSLLSASAFVACGGSLDDVSAGDIANGPTPDAPAPPDAPTSGGPERPSGSEAPASGPAPASGFAPASGPAPASAPTPAPAAKPTLVCVSVAKPNLDDCEAAQKSLAAEVLGIDFPDNDAWKSGAKGILRVRMKNLATDHAVPYPGIAVDASTPSLTFDFPGVGPNGHVPPQLYSAAPCSSSDHAIMLEVGSTLASGTTVKITLSLGAAESEAHGWGIGTCGGTLPKVEHVVAVP